VVAVLPASASTADPVTLRAQALASLEAGYRVLLTGRQTEVLVADRGEVGVERTSAERLAATLYRRDFNAQYGVRFTAIEVELVTTGLEVAGSTAILHADEHVKMHFASGWEVDPERDLTRMRIPHSFVFSQTERAWRLDFDDAGGMRDGGKTVDAGTDVTPARIRPQSSSTGGRLAAIEPYDSAAAYIRPDVSPRLESAYGTYWPNPAGDYAYNWAYSRNSAYRDFSPDDCTNFISQALRAGGWTDKYGFYWDWNNWWYQSYDQTTSWTYVAALRQFMSTSGRAQGLAYINDLQKGDVLQADFGQNGSWDHSLMIDAKYSSNLADIYVSYHSIDTQHRHMSDFLAAVQSQYGNTTYNAWHIIFTSN
jgi:hypothetical protein